MTDDRIKEKAHFYDGLAYAIGQLLNERLGMEIGYCLLVFPSDHREGHGELADYISNSDKEYVITILRNMIKKLKNREEL
jgi:hypothetical protein